MTTTIKHLTPRLTAMLAALACFMTLAASDAQAAPAFNQNSSRSNNAKAGQAASAEVEATLAELQALLASETEAIAQLRSVMQAAGSLVRSASELGLTLVEQQRLAGDEQGAALAEIDEAARVFEEQVASLLDPEAQAAVRADLEQSTASIRATATLTDGSSAEVTAALTQAEELLSTIEAAVEELSKVVEKATSGVKQTMQTQV